MVSQSVIWTKPRNTCKQIHTHSETDKESKFLTALSFHRTAILWGCLHSGRIKAFMVQTKSPGGLCTWLCERTCVCLCVHVGLWLEAPAQLKAVPGPYPGLVWAGDECVWPQPPSTTQPSWKTAVTTWSISGALCLRVACIFNIAEGQSNCFSYHIHISEKWDNYAHERCWHSLEMRSIFAHGNRLDRQWHTQTDTHGCNEVVHASTRTGVHAQPPTLPPCPLPYRHTPADSLEHYMGCN